MSDGTIYNDAEATRDFEFIHAWRRWRHAAATTEDGGDRHIRVTDICVIEKRMSPPNSCLRLVTGLSNDQCSDYGRTTNGAFKRNDIHCITHIVHMPNKMHGITFAKRGVWTVTHAVWRFISRSDWQLLSVI